MIKKAITLAVVLVMLMASQCYAKKTALTNFELDELARHIEINLSSMGIRAHFIQDNPNEMTLTIEASKYKFVTVKNSDGTLQNLIWYDIGGSAAGKGMLTVLNESIFATIGFPKEDRIESNPVDNHRTGVTTWNIRSKRLKQELLYQIKYDSKNNRTLFSLGNEPIDSALNSIQLAENTNSLIGFGIDEYIKHLQMNLNGRGITSEISKNSQNDIDVTVKNQKSGFSTYRMIAKTKSNGSIEGVVWYLKTGNPTVYEDMDFIRSICDTLEIESNSVHTFAFGSHLQRIGDGVFVGSFLDKQKGYSIRYGNRYNGDIIIRGIVCEPINLNDLWYDIDGLEESTESYDEKIFKQEIEELSVLSQHGAQAIYAQLPSIYHDIPDYKLTDLHTRDNKTYSCTAYYKDSSCDIYFTQNDKGKLDTAAIMFDSDDERDAAIASYGKITMAIGMSTADALNLHANAIHNAEQRLYVQKLAGNTIMHGLSDIYDSSRKHFSLMFAYDEIAKKFSLLLGVIAPSPSEIADYRNELGMN